VPLAVFVVCLFLLYSSMTVVIQMTSATTVNLAILSADFYTLLFGLFLFGYKVQSTLDISKFLGLFFTCSNYPQCKLICTSGNLDL